MAYRLPTDATRHMIVGMTGSGKTQAGVYALSKRSFDKMPWTIIDFKRDKLINKIPRVEEYDYTQRKLPKAPGLYVVRPDPRDDDELMEQFLFRIWDQEKHGFFLDEGYMIKHHSKGLRALLTQGRSKRTPGILLSQRPAYVSPFLLSESEFIQAFSLRNPNDLDRMHKTIYTKDMPAHKSYKSLWYDVEMNKLTTLAPVPPMAEILSRFDDRVPKRRIWI
jgi:hypothetical protein